MYFIAGLITVSKGLENIFEKMAFINILGQNLFFVDLLGILLHTWLGPKKGRACATEMK